MIEDVTVYNLETPL